MHLPAGLKDADKCLNIEYFVCTVNFHGCHEYILLVGSEHVNNKPWLLYALFYSTFLPNRSPLIFSNSKLEKDLAILVNHI